MKRLVLAAAVTLIAPAAIAQPSPASKAAAEQAFMKGNTAYNLGHFDEAITWFTKAYEDWPEPEFLYNIAQAYRLSGNCQQALFLYQRFLSAKEHDTGSPLSDKKRHEVERFISELTDCANKAQSTANAKPDGVDRPPEAATGPAPAEATTSGTPAPAPATTASPAPAGDAQPAADARPPAAAATTPAGPRVASADLAKEDASVEQESAPAPASTKPILLARLTGGATVIGAGDLQIPVQPVFGVGAAYPIALGPVVLEAGAALSYTPLPYEVMGAEKSGTMLGAHLVAGIDVPVTAALTARGELGLGVLSLGGLEAGNPLTKSMQAGSFALFNVRVGVAVDYALTRNLIATLSPFSFGYSPGASDLYASSLHDIQFAAGIGYRR